MEYITTKETSAKWGISATRITILAKEGRIPGAQRIGKSWLIPVNATKPPKQKSGRSNSAERETDHFSFPLYPYRPDWSEAKEAQLSAQQHSLLLAEKAVLEYRFDDAYPLLKSILRAPDDISIEIGCLWNIGICCIALNKPDEFSGIFLRIQLLLSEDFPHRNDLAIIFDFLKTYVETISSAANIYTYHTDIHDQCLPLACMHLGYAHLTKEAVKSGTADTALLELNLRFLKKTCAVIAVEMMHCYLLGIYYLRQNMEAAEKHAKAAVQIAFENKFYFPMATFCHYFTPVLSPILAQYPKEFQNHCHNAVSQYEKNFTAFVSAISEDAAILKLTDADRPYIRGVLMGLSNTRIADELGISPQTAKRRLIKICEKLGVKSKKELRDYLYNYL